MLILSSSDDGTSTSWYNLLRDRRGVGGCVNAFTRRMFLREASLTRAAMLRAAIGEGIPPLQLNQSITRSLTFVPIVFSILVFIGAFFAGISSGVATSVDHLVPNIIGIGAVISAKTFGLKGHPREAYESVQAALVNHGLDNTVPGFNPNNFRNYDLIRSAFESAENAEVCASPLISVPFNDQGAIDYTQVAFRAFGIDAKSLYYLYFVIIGLSAGAFLISFWRDYVACTALFAAACAIYTFLFGYVVHDDQLLSVANPRFLSTIGILPLLHVAFFVLRGEAPLRWRSISTILGQSAILSFAYAARSTSSWMVLVLLVLFAIYLVRSLAPAFRWRQPAFAYSIIYRRGATVLLALAALTTIGTACNMLLAPRCQTDQYSHVVWHNIFLGFSSSSQWKPFGPLYDNAEGDQLSFTAAKVYIKRHHLPYSTEPNIFLQDKRTGEFTPLGSWATYDKLMRSVVFEFVREHPLFALKSFLWYRPLTFVRAMHVFADSALSTMPATVFVIVLTMCICIALAKPVPLPEHSNVLRFSLLTGVLALCFLVSLDSVFIVYSTDFLISDQAYLLVMISVVLSVWGLARLFTLIGSQVTAPQALRS